MAEHTSSLLQRVTVVNHRPHEKGGAFRITKHVPRRPEDPHEKTIHFDEHGTPIEPPTKTNCQN